MRQRGRKSAAAMAAIAAYPDVDRPRPPYDPPRPPQHLAEPERQLWDDLVRSYQLECAAHIRRDGLVLTGKRGGIKVHPLFAAEQRACRGYYDGIKALRLGR